MLSDVFATPTFVFLSFPYFSEGSEVHTSNPASCTPCVLGPRVGTLYITYAAPHQPHSPSHGPDPSHCQSSPHWPVTDSQAGLFFFFL